MPGSSSWTSCAPQGVKGFGDEVKCKVDINA